MTAFLRALPAEWRPFFDFLAQTGLRIWEAIELRWGDVEGSWLRVNRRFYRGRVAPPKGRKRRSVPLSRDLAQVLWTRRGRNDELVWTSPGDRRIDQSNVMSRILKPTARTVGIGDWPGFHAFRHTAATRLFRRGWNAVQVQRFLGHSDPGFTLRTYVHLLPDDLPEPDFGAGVSTKASTSRRNGPRRRRGRRHDPPANPRHTEARRGRWTQLIIRWSVVRVHPDPFSAPLGGAENASTAQRCEPRRCGTPPKAKATRPAAQFRIHGGGNLNVLAPTRGGWT